MITIRGAIAPPDSIARAPKPDANVSDAYNRVTVR